VDECDAERGVLPGIERLSVASDPRTLAFIGIITVVGAFTACFQCCRRDASR
jgi:hypothetical protein